MSGRFCIQSWILALAAASPAHAADDGESIFQSECVRCHAPAEMSGRLTANWVGRSADELYQRIKTTMPTESPGSRSDDDYLSVTGYILAQANMAVSMLSGNTARLTKVASPAHSKRNGQ